MRIANVSILGMAMAAAIAATACNRADETASTSYNEPATTADQPDTAATPPATAPATTAATDAAATNTASTDAEAPTSTAPVASPSTMADATTPFDDMDINNDNGLSQDELPDSHPLRQAFTVVDSDGNGMLSRAEVDSYRAKTPPSGG